MNTQPRGGGDVLINITGGEDLSLFEVNEASTLIQEAAHEDANIIFGAVIDDQMAAGEMRVTVIATGLDDSRVRRSPDIGHRTESHANVTPLRLESNSAPGQLETLPAARDSQPSQAEFRELPVSQTPLHPEPATEHGADWVSPFDEEELDIPTFLRRSAD